MDGVAPAVGNAVLDAVGVNIDSNPITAGEGVEGNEGAVFSNQLSVISNQLSVISGQRSGQAVSLPCVL